MDEDEAVIRQSKTAYSKHILAYSVLGADCVAIVVLTKDNP